MGDERYVMVISQDGKTVRLQDEYTDEIDEFHGPRALFDALGVLAEYRERDAAFEGEE